MWCAVTLWYCRFFRRYTRSCVHVYAEQEEEEVAYAEVVVLHQ